MDDDDALRFTDLRLSFGARALYTGLNLAVRRGETLALIGRSGTGKSVLLKCALRLAVPDSGSVLAFGEEVTTRSERTMGPLRQRIGMMFQSYALFDSISVAENVAWPLRVRGVDDEAAIAARVEELLALVNLPGVGARRPAELSGGMKKRVSLARALANEPELLFYAGPTTGLDPANARRVDGIIARLKAERGVTSILVTHDIAGIERCADRVAMLHEGGVVWVGPVADMKSHSPDVVRNFVTGNFRAQYDPKGPVARARPEDQSGLSASSARGTP